jgi:hypothetical protein
VPIVKRLNRYSCIAVVLLTLIAGGAHGQDSDVAPPEQQTLIIVVGAEGLPRYGQQLQTWAERLATAAAQGQTVVERLGPDASLDFEPPVSDADHQHDAAADTPADNPADSAGVNQTADVRPQTNDLARLKQLLSQYGGVETTEPLWLVLLGHGAYDTRQASFSLRGPDLTDAALAEMLQSARRPVAVVCGFSCSAPFLNAVSGPQRIVITSTKDGNQVQWSRFGDAFTEAFATSDSDIDRDGQTSLLEAWLFAARRTAEFYSIDGRIASEHALLDDNGDARGTRSELYEGVRISGDVKDPAAVDGQLAAKWHLVRSDEEQRLTVEQRAERDRLEAELGSLKGKKQTMPETEYLDALEPILLQLARIYAVAEEAVDSGQE